MQTQLQHLQPLRNISAKSFLVDQFLDRLSPTEIKDIGSGVSILNDSDFVKIKGDVNSMFGIYSPAAVAHDSTRLYGRIPFPAKTVDKWFREVVNGDRIDFPEDMEFRVRVIGFGGGKFSPPVAWVVPAARDMDHAIKEWNRERNRRDKDNRWLSEVLYSTYPELISDRCYAIYQEFAKKTTRITGIDCKIVAYNDQLKAALMLKKTNHAASRVVYLKDAEVVAMLLDKPGDKKLELEEALSSVLCL